MNTLSYKGYLATVEFDPQDMILVGHLAGIRDVIGFHAENGHDLVAAFHDAVDDYVAACRKAGKSPQKPHSGRLMLRVDPAVHAQAVLAAELAGKSLNAWSELVLKAAAEQSVKNQMAA